MKNMNLKIAMELNKIAKELVAKDYEYIYDPDHKKHPGGGYQKTEKGWQKGKEDNDKKLENFSYNPQKDNYHEMLNRIDNIKDSDKLAQLANHQEWQVRKAVAYHPNTSKETLAQLAKDENYNVRCMVALNHNTPQQSLIDLCSDENVVVKGYVATRKLPKEGEMKLVQDSDERVRYALATSENASKEALALLGKDKKKKVLQAVANNKNTPIETLEQLAKKKNKDISTEIASNESASPEILSYIYNNIPYDKIEEYGNCATNLGRNSNTPPEIIENLYDESPSFGSSDTYIKLSIVRNIHTPGTTFEKIFQSGDNSLKKIANETCQKKYNNESVYLDDEGQEYFIDQLEEEYDELKNSGDTEAKDFNEYFANITSGNGGLRELKYTKKPQEDIKTQFSNIGIDLTKLSPELREKVKDWDAEDIKKFLGWLKNHKGNGIK